MADRAGVVDLVVAISPVAGRLPHLQNVVHFVDEVDSNPGGVLDAVAVGEVADS